MTWKRIEIDDAEEEDAGDSPELNYGKDGHQWPRVSVAVHYWDDPMEGYELYCQTSASPKAWWYKRCIPDDCIDDAIGLLKEAVEFYRAGRKGQ